MPGRANRGCLFAVSGRATTAFGRRRKRGLYHHCTNEIFRPSWGPIRQPPLIENSKLPNWASDALSPAEKVPPKPQYHRDARMAWPAEKPSYVMNMYRRNMQRYLKTAEAANDDHVRSYIFNALTPAYRIGARGMYSAQEKSNPPRHIVELVKEVNQVSAPSLDLRKKEENVPIYKRMECLIKQSASWRTTAQLQESCANPFPHVNESASLVRNLGLSDVLHTRSDHRLARRAHPKWYAARYRKFLDKKALQEKLLQLKIETGV